MEYSKNFIDYINAWHSQTPKLSVSDFTRSARSLHFYDSIVVVEKDEVSKPYDSRTGEEKIKQYNPPRDRMRDFKTKIKRFFRF